jgi:diguanylate cyclase (GGDEF)-like protein
VLAEAARRLNAMVRSGELIARIGGEEFGWLLPETTEDSAFAAAERVRRGISATPFEGVGTLTFSVGLCSNAHARTAQQLFDFADQALYRSKSRGRNATSIYTVDDRRARPGATHLVGSAGPVISA